MVENSNFLSFYKGSEDFIRLKLGDSPAPDDAISLVRSQMSEALSARHVSFLLGAGASSFVKAGLQLGVPTMLPLAREFLASENTDYTVFPSPEERTTLAQTYAVDLAGAEYAANLEHLMEVLFALRFVLHATSVDKDDEGAKAVASVVNKIKAFLLNRCTKGAFAEGDDTVVALYQRFYRKLMLRDRSLPRPWVFTTNYDLFSELAMDRLGMHYCNGFSGAIERRFNPSVFRYALAEQLDISSRKWNAVEGFVYLAKLHGSVSWVEDNKGLFPIRETQEISSGRNVMIYPTPAKQSSSLASPYSDLFREFQSQITQNQSVLVTVGYSFSDEHINNLIYQALTIPTFRLIIVASPDANEELRKIKNLQDPRIWMFGGKMSDGASAHYFNNFVDEFMPVLPGDRIDKAIHRVVEELISDRRAGGQNGGGDSN